MSGMNMLFSFITLGSFSNWSSGSIIYTKEKFVCRASALSVSLSASCSQLHESIHFRLPTPDFDVFSMYIFPESFWISFTFHRNTVLFLLC